jgi:hypothetical protein
MTLQLIAHMAIVVGLREQCAADGGACSASFPAIAQKVPNRTLLGLELQLNPTSGWGNFGINVLVDFAFNNSMPFYPVITMTPNWRCNAAAYAQVKTIAHCEHTAS